ncbi:MAG: hypothetical protein IPL28_24670 [Chloroflexi bacterium]|nr:hypothetical protein [Chloroflexota bacterium]
MTPQSGRSGREPMSVRNFVDFVGQVAVAGQQRHMASDVVAGQMVGQRPPTVGASHKAVEQEATHPPAPMAKCFPFRGNVGAGVVGHGGGIWLFVIGYSLLVVGYCSGVTRPNNE